MSLLKVSALTCSGFILWLVPPFILSRKIPLHNMTTGLALIGGFACCFEARRVALKLSQAEDFEAMKEAVIVADTVDELATSAYISEQQRRMEAESILNSNEQTDEQEAELNSMRESLELLLNNKSSDSGELAVVNLSARQREQIELILRCHIKGIHGKNKILKEVWGVSAGSSQAYRDAKAEYEFLMPFVKGEGDEQ